MKAGCAGDQRRRKKSPGKTGGGLGRPTGSGKGNRWMAHEEGLGGSPSGERKTISSAGITSPWGWGGERQPTAKMSDTHADQKKGQPQKSDLRKALSTDRGGKVEGISAKTLAPNGNANLEESNLRNPRRE